MRLPCSVSTTTLRRHRQAVIPPYVIPLSNPTLKTTRTKVPMKPTSYNRRFALDVWFCLKALRPTDEQVKARQNLQNILQNAIQAHFGQTFEVQYIGLARYATETSEEPYEFAIVDMSVEQGIVGKEHLENLPPAYDPVRVMQVLQTEGFGGTTRHPSERNYSVCWPAYSRIPCREVIYPARLRAHHPVTFDLILPGPTVIPLIKLLSAYSKIAPEVPQLITLLFLFLKSFDIRDVSPICVALLVVKFLQEVHAFPCLTSSKDKVNGRSYDAVLAAGNAYRWTLHEYFFTSPQSQKWVTEHVRLDTAFVDSPTIKTVGSNPALLLDEFMEYWGRISKSVKSLAFSVNSGSRIQRSWLYAPVNATDLPATVQKQSKGTYDQGKQSPIWKIHPLVVPDPFVRTHNHAENVSQAAVDYFRNEASVAQKGIRSTFPLLSIFGPHLDLISSTHDTRLNVPWGSLNSYPTEILQPPPLYIRNGRSSTVKRVEDVIQRAFDGKYRVEVFGSTMHGLDTSTSDLDLVVIDPDRMDGFPRDVDLQKLPMVYDVSRIGRELKKAGFTKIICIPKANVPIVKFRDPHSGIECDLNVNDQLGSINTAMIKRYLDLQPILRPLLKTVKIWAKSLGLNSPSGGDIISFSSYALTLMTIGFFQVKGWLPNLQDVKDSDSDAKSGVFWMKTKQGRRYRCDVRYARVGSYPLLEVELEEALLQWFSYWGREFRYSTDIVCISRGGVVPRKDKFINAPRSKVPSRKTLDSPEVLDNRAKPQNLFEDDESGDQFSDDDEILETGDVLSSDPKEWSTHALCVADPFILAKNCCSHINPNVVTEFMYDCQSAETFLRSGISLRDLIFNAAQGPPNESRATHTNRRNQKKPKPEKKTEKKPELTDTVAHADLAKNAGQAAENSATRTERNWRERRKKTSASAVPRGTGGAPLITKASDRASVPAPSQPNDSPRAID